MTWAQKRVVPLALVIVAIAAAVLISTGDGDGASRARAGHGRLAGLPDSTGADLAACGDPVASTVGYMARRTYRNDGSGLNSVYSRGRVEGSRALADAVARGDAAGATTALRKVLYHQITRIAVYRGVSLLAEIGHEPALAPVRGVLKDRSGRVVGRYVFSIQGDGAFAGLTGSSASSQVIIRDGTRQLVGSLVPGPAQIPDRGAVSYAGVTYGAYSFAGTSFTGGRIRISYLIPPDGVASVCGSSPEATVLNTIARRALGIYHGELFSAQTQAAAQIISRSQAMIAAVQSSSPTAVRAAIVGLFRTRLHIVRIRVTSAGSLINDVGGPAVLAPVAGEFHDRAGRVIGQFLFSLQDDAGYLKLVHIFSGGEVLMRVGGRQVAGTISPGPAHPPDFGPVTYRGVTYQAFSFPATAFPNSPLRITILIVASRYL
jgi:hypothetical protein